MPALPLVMFSVPAPPLATGPRTEIVSFQPGEISCAGQPVAAAGLVRPLSAVATRYGTDGDGAPMPVYRFTFAIDAQGRAGTIRRDAAVPASRYVDTGDLAPSLAASRFPVGAPAPACSIMYQASVAPIETADMRTLYELASRPETNGYAAAIQERVRPADSTCRSEPGQYRRLNLPAFETLPAPEGGAAWVFLAFDVDRGGKPGHARVLGSSGDAALDGAGMRALLANRYAPGRGYRGCTYHFFHNGFADRPSPVLPADAPADNADQPGCAIDPRSIPGLLDGSAYPRPFSRRRIEGVAVIGFETAPWGEVGNVKVLVAEPDEAFGVAAREALSSARVAASDTGRRGCVQRVRFKLPPGPRPR
jgi:TonB family protein